MSKNSSSAETPQVTPNGSSLSEIWAFLTAPKTTHRAPIPNPYKGISTARTQPQPAPIPPARAERVLTVADLTPHEKSHLRFLYSQIGITDWPQLLRESELRRLYRRLAHRCHPDRYPLASADKHQQLSLEFGKLRQAYTDLRTALKRSAANSDLSAKAA